MANVLRPLRAPTDRRTRLNLSPVTPDDLRRHRTTTSRPSLRNSPLLALAHDDDKSVKQSTSLPTRTNSRKRPAAALGPDAAGRKPLSKIAAIAQPHGDLLRVPNGVAASSANDPDHVSSTRSTPQPAGAGKLASQDKRSLRSHDGSSRLKTDLPTYFSNYDDVIAGLPKPAELVHLDTPIYIVDEPTKTKTSTTTTATQTPQVSQPPSSPTWSRKRRASWSSRRTSIPVIPPSQSSTTFQVLDYTSIAKHLHYDDGHDPLADSEYFTQHRRAERKEKQLRNIEKERAMHEKVQLERLLDGLQGPDWLKVMGITGVTDGERKDWEPKRDYFVKEVEALVDKFRLWKEEEKRLRAEKEAALLAREEEDDDEDEESATQSSESITVNSSSRHHNNSTHHHHHHHHHHHNNHTSTSTTQLSPPKPRRPNAFLIPLHPLPLPTEPFQSFYAKPHLRAAAMGKHRHGRNASAFGLPIPEFVEQEFEIPEEYLDPMFLRDNARQRRRRKRERADTAAGGGGAVTTSGGGVGAGSASGGSVKGSVAASAAGRSSSGHEKEKERQKEQQKEKEKEES